MLDFAFGIRFLFICSLFISDCCFGIEHKMPNSPSEIRNNGNAILQLWDFHGWIAGLIQNFESESEVQSVGFGFWFWRIACCILPFAFWFPILDLGFSGLDSQFWFLVKIPSLMLLIWDFDCGIWHFIFEFDFILKYKQQSSETEI